MTIEEEAYMIGQESHRIKVGDIVKVLRKARSYENGWNSRWESEMDNAIGKLFTVERINGGYGILLKFYGDVVHPFPWFVLEKRGREDVNSLDIIQTSDLDFGSQQEHINTLIERIKSYIDKKVLNC